MTACMHAQGLFERHKLIVASQLCVAVLKRSGQLSQAKFEFLLRGPRREGVENPLKDWLSDSVWASIQALKARPRIEQRIIPLCLAGQRLLRASELHRTWTSTAACRMTWRARPSGGRSGWSWSGRKRMCSQVRMLTLAPRWETQGACRCALTPLLTRHRRRLEAHAGV